MRTGDSQHPAPVQHVVGEPLRTGDVGQPAIENLLEQRVAARNSVADHVAVGVEPNLLGTVAFDQFDPGRFELRTHRRIDTGVAAGNTMSGRPRELGDSAHEGAADAENVNMHVIVPR